MTVLSVDFVTETCCYEDCNITFAFTRDFYNRVRNDHSWWFCPRGHTQHYTGESDQQKLERAKIREQQLNDQLRAAIRDAEATRVALVRDRSRFVNGVCPCCSRSFENVRRHMETKHPDYDVNEVLVALKYECSCGRRFETFKGLRIHQGALRGPNWDVPKTSRWIAHLTKV